MPLPRPAPGTAKWWVVGVVGCLARHGPRHLVGPGQHARPGHAGPTWATRTSTDRSISVTYDVHRPDGRDVSCVVRALDSTTARSGR